MTYCPEYAAWFLRSQLGQRQINRLYTGATGLIELPEDAVKRILVLVPNTGEQEALVGEWVTEVRGAEILEHEAQAKRQWGHDRFIARLQTW